MMTEKCNKCQKFTAEADFAEAGLCKSCATKAKSSGQQPIIQLSNLTQLVPSFTGRIELPPFIPENVNLWWAQVEARLKLWGIIDEHTKYRYVVAALPGEVARKIPELVFTEPSEAPFTVLHQAILKEFEPTCSAKMRQLLEGCQLGDRKPSALLREMRRLAGENSSNDMLRELFFKQLPDNVTSVLKIVDVTDLDKAAAAADKVLESPAPVIAAYSASSALAKPPNQSTSNLTEITAQIASLTNAVKELAAHQQYRQPRQPYRSNFRSRSQSRARNRSPTPKREMCYYHYRFGNDARHCRPWCKRYSDWNAGKKVDTTKSENEKGSR